MFPLLLFQYMLLLRGATRRSRCRCSGRRFNTCSSCEEQRAVRRGVRLRGGFNTCSSCEEQLPRNTSSTQFSCFNTCSSCEEQLGIPVLTAGLTVSIHAPLARSNIRPAVLNLHIRSFNTCSSCEEQRVDFEVFAVFFHKFQYMLLLRGATGAHPRRGRGQHWFQYMLLLRGATRTPHTLAQLRKFQYMLLLRGATAAV